MRPSIAFPGGKETVELRTWTAQETPLLARRNLEIRDAQGNCIVAASCLWAVIDIRRRRPVPLNRHISFSRIPHAKKR